MLKIGDKLPEFNLKGVDSHGAEQVFTNQSFLGKHLIMYFYPKDDTPECTTESCNFNTMLSKIKEKANVIGISDDTANSHVAFQQKFNLKFPLLSDTNADFAKKLGLGFARFKLTPEEFSEATERTTLLVDKNGVVQQIWNQVKVIGHDEEVLKNLEKLG